MSFPGSSLPSNVPPRGMPRGMPPGPKRPPNKRLRIVGVVVLALVVAGLVFLLL